MVPLHNREAKEAFHEDLKLTALTALTAGPLDSILTRPWPWSAIGP
jgi:hypothetical protein